MCLGHGQAKLMKGLECQAKELGWIYPEGNGESEEIFKLGVTPFSHPPDLAPRLLFGKLSHVPSAPALSADHQGPETARDRWGHAAD